MAAHEAKTPAMEPALAPDGDAVHAPPSTVAPAADDSSLAREEVAIVLNEGRGPGCLDNGAPDIVFQPLVTSARACLPSALSLSCE